MIVGYDDLDTAIFVAQEYGDGAHLVGTRAQAYRPSPATTGAVIPESVVRKFTRTIGLGDDLCDRI